MLIRRVKATVSAHVVIVDHKRDTNPVRILLTRLAYQDHRAGKYCFPGGYVDQGEELDEALKREVNEEIGLELLKYNLVKTVPVLQGEQSNIGFIYVCHDWAGTPAIKSHEILEIIWVDEPSFWQLDRDGQLAYPQMREQMSCLGWQSTRQETYPS
ncbi:MAG: NUDIX hydrolase [Magnetococcales bacterium]|nr:NUDIX hydrolase [Magnetococcales bacterium]MBF0438998.1 NUDIX hydrolase [Magnetococcales bacterium]